MGGGTNHAENPAEYNVSSEKITLLEPSKTGYRFDGWYTDDTYIIPVTEIAAGSVSDVTLYAKWTINQYTVMWVTNGGNDLTGDYTTTADYGTVIKLPNTPTKDQTESTTYTFAGWYTNVACTQALEDGAIVPENGMTLYAKWTETARKYTITWDKTEFSTGKPSKELAYGTAISPNNPIAVGYVSRGIKYTRTLLGWYTEPGGKGTKLQEGDIVTRDVTYYAYWHSVLTKYTMNFNTGAAGGTIAPQEVEYGGLLTQPTLDPAIHGIYGEFDGWYTRDGVKWNFATDTVEPRNPIQNITLYMRWKQLYGYDQESLTDAIKSTSEGGTVKLTDNITLTSALSVTKNMTIDGNGKTITVGTQAMTTALYLISHEYTIKNLTINGASKAMRGIWMRDAQVTLNGVTIQNCNANQSNIWSERNGGAIFNWYQSSDKGSSVLTCTNCNFTGNVATLGGAVYLNTGSGNFTNCTFSGNTSTGAGGALNLTGGKASRITGGSFSNNIGYLGGAIDMSGADTKLTLSGVTFSGNTTSQTATGDYSGGTGNNVFLEWNRSSGGQPSATFTNNGTVANGTYTPKADPGYSIG